MPTLKRPSKRITGNREAQVIVRMTPEDRERLKTIARAARLDVGPFMLSAAFEKARRDGLLDE